MYNVVYYNYIQNIMNERPASDFIHEGVQDKLNKAIAEVLNEYKILIKDEKISAPEFVQLVREKIFGEKGIKFNLEEDKPDSKGDPATQSLIDHLNTIYTPEAISQSVAVDPDAPDFLRELLEDEYISPR